MTGAGSGVRKATAADVPRLAQALAAAFIDDPVLTWMIPDGDRRRRIAPYGYETWLRRLYLPHDEVYTEGRLVGAALWAPPGEWRIPVRRQLAMALPSLRLFVGRTPVLMKGLALIQSKHPPDPPHWYLGILGTDPAHQGRGIGSALVQPVLERCDRDGVPAYLESSKERNVPYYRRFGFTVTEEYQLPKGPPLWGMWREPQPQP